MAKKRYQVRVIAGELKGRLLEYPAVLPLRPTMQRTKSSTFGTLGESIRGSVFVDLFAAAGGMGIEALSRGAELACFVERDTRALEFLHRNLEACGIAPHRYQIHRSEVARFLGMGHMEKIHPDFVYVDPPYGDTDFAVLLELFGKIVYSASVVIILEHPTEVSLDPGVQLVTKKVRSFGQTSVSFFSSAGEGDSR